MAVMAVFLFWGLGAIIEDNGDAAHIAARTTAGIVSLCLSIFFGLICFIRYLRSRTVNGSLFLTTALSMAVFLGASRFIGALIPEVAIAERVAAEGGGGGGPGMVILLAQVGLFTLWFAFLMLTIYIHVSPIRKVNRALEQILDGKEIKRLKIGKSRQYREIALNLKKLSREMKKLEKTEKEKNRGA